MRTGRSVMTHKLVRLRSYFTVARVYPDNPEQAVPGWLMFPATWTATHVTAWGLLITGMLMWVRVGGIPRPRHHPLR